MLLELLTPVAAILLALTPITRTLIVSIFASRLVKRTGDPKVLDRYARVVGAARGRSLIQIRRRT